MRFLALLGLLAPLLAMACSSSDSGSKGSPATVKACNDTVDAVAKAGARCGSSYDATKAEFEKASGGCGNISAIRDEASLRAKCIPSLDTIACADLTAGRLDASCMGQLLKSTSPSVSPPGTSHVQSTILAED